MQSHQTKIAGMGFIKPLLYAGIIFIITTVYCVDEAIGNIFNETIDYCLLDNIVPVHYNIKLIPYTEESEFIYLGECNVNIKICHATANISLHSRDLQINETETALINNNGTMYKPSSHNYNKMYITDLIFDNVLSPGLYILYVRYFRNTSFLDQGNEILYTDREYKLWLVRAPFPSVAVRLNPRCFDDPTLRAAYNISVKHHRKYKALSNMPIREECTDADGMIWSHFDIILRMRSCTLMVAVLNFDRVPNANETVNMWCRSNCTSQIQFAQGVVEKVAQHMVWYTNISEKVPKTDHIVIPNYPREGRSFWGFLLYNEDSIRDTDLNGTPHKRHIAKIMAHEMIHQWFGNLVSVLWPDFWLHEGAASFFQAYILNKIFKDWRTMDFLVIESLHGSLRTDTGSIMNSLASGMNNEVETYSAFYDKAPVILRMLQHIITEEVFRKGVITYLHTHQFKSATADDLWTAMQTALDESNVPHRDFKIKEVIDSWIDQIHYPLVTVTRNYETGEVVISQEHYHLQEDKENNVTDDAKWWIPITYTTQTNPDFTNTSLNFRWLSPRDENISFVINPNDWIILNLQQTGYYRVNYDITNWRKIADYLNSNEYTKIHVLNRAQLIDDAFHFVMERQLDSSVFLNLSNYLLRETDYIAWYPIFYLLPKIWKVFSLPGSETLKSQLAGMFNGLLENVGYEENPNEDEIMIQKRLTTLNWACFLNNSICKRMATTKLDKHLANPDSYILSPSLHYWTYCTGLMAANMTTWNKVMNLYTEKSDSNFLEYLACSEDPDIIIHYLNIISSNNSIIQEKEHKFVFNYIIKKNVRNNLVLGYILENLERIKPKLMTTEYVLKNIILAVISKEQLGKVHEFMKNNINRENSFAIRSAILERYIALYEEVNIYSERFISNRN